MKSSDLNDRARAGTLGDPTADTVPAPLPHRASPTPEPAPEPPAPAPSDPPPSAEQPRAEASNSSNGASDATPVPAAVKPWPAGLPRPVGAMRESVLARLRRRHSGQEKPIETPWADLNAQLCGGWWPGVHVLISGTGAGKSQLVIEACTEAAYAGRAAVGYAALELDETGVLARIAGRLAWLRSKRSLSWSDVSRGMVDPDSHLMVEAFQSMSDLPFHLDTGSTTGWAMSNVETTAKGLREVYGPEKPLLLVVDFLQLVAGENGARKDLRERIGNAAYQAQQVARDYGAAIVLVSSTARQNYDLFGDKGFTSAGLSVVASKDASKDNGPRRIIASPDALVGLGKETGEIEYAADSVTVMARVPRDRIGSDKHGFSPVVLATAKLRAGPPSWCVLGGNGQSFRPWEGNDSAVADALSPQKKEKSSRPPGANASGADGNAAQDDDGPDMPEGLRGG